MANTDITRGSILNFDSSTTGTVLAKGTTGERPGPGFNAQVVVIAGGGGSGSSGGRAGGGGAGGYRTNASFPLTTNLAYPITVGQGGKGANTQSNTSTDKGYNGSDSTFSTITSTGGGGGGGWYTGSTANGKDGGSGGGGATTTSTSSGGQGNTPSVNPSQGNSGGGGYYSSGYGGGGGGGAAGAGQTGVNADAGDGGAGTTSTIINATNATANDIGHVVSGNVYFAGGGAGGYSANNPGVGGNGGGGNSGGDNFGLFPGKNRAGGGAGGGAYSTYSLTASTNGNASLAPVGGDGVVILRFPTASVSSVSLTGTLKTPSTTNTVSQVNYPSGKTCVAYYRFNDNLNDETSNGYDLTANNPATDPYSYGKFDKAYRMRQYCSGTTPVAQGYLSASNPIIQPNTATGFAISVWVMHTEFYNSCSSAGTGIGSCYFSNMTQGATTQQGIGLSNRIQSSGQPYTVRFFFNGITNYITGTTGLNINEWNHIVGTYDGSTAKIYVNGVEDASQSVVITPVTTAQNAVFGRFYPNFNDYYFGGLIDQVRIYNEGLSATDVTDLYNEKFATLITEGSDSIYVFDQGSGNITFNSNQDPPPDGAFRYNTTLSKLEYYDGSNWYTIDNEPAVPTLNAANKNFDTLLYSGNSSTQTIGGYINGAASFNGSSSKIDTGFNQNVGSNFSWSLWFYSHVSDTNYRMLIDKTNPNNPYPGAGIALQGGSVYGMTNGTGGALTYTDNAYDINKWYHVVLTSDGSTVKLYLNSVEVGTGSVTINNTSQNILIGDSVTWTTNYDGLIDQVRIYGSTLSSADVKALYGETSTTASTLAFPSGQTAIATYQLDTNADDLSNNYDGTSTSVTYNNNLNFQPDFVWIKARSTGYTHSLQDSLRGTGTTKSIYSDLPSAEGTYGVYGQLSAFGSYGFTVAGGGSATFPYAQVNQSGVDYVSWNWKAGGQPITNNDGNIASQVSANVEAGFSIVTYSPNNNVGMTVGHGLNQAPSIVITKRLDTSQDWGVYTNVSTGTAATNWLSLNDYDPYGVGNYMNLLSSTLELPAAGAFWASPSSNQVAYCWHPVAGYSSIGVYSGTGATNNVITGLGFQPNWLMVKRIDTGTNSWLIVDSKRVESNGNLGHLFADTVTAEGSTGYDIDFTSDGFTLNTTTNNANASGTDNYLYMAFA